MQHNKDRLTLIQVENQGTCTITWVSVGSLLHNKHVGERLSFPEFVIASLFLLVGGIDSQTFDRQEIAHKHHNYLGGHLSY